MNHLHPFLVSANPSPRPVLCTIYSIFLMHTLYLTSFRSAQSTHLRRCNTCAQWQNCFGPSTQSLKTTSQDRTWRCQSAALREIVSFQPLFSSLLLSPKCIFSYLEKPTPRSIETQGHRFPHLQGVDDTEEPFQDLKDFLAQPLRRHSCVPKVFVVFTNFLGKKGVFTKLCVSQNHIAAFNS